MCGIAGFNLNKKDADLDGWLLAAVLLIGIEHRGPHATGIGWTEPNGDVYTQKLDVKATEFVKTNMDLPDTASNVILHTRYFTKGTPKVEANNHPIVRPGIVGTHNGILHNDEALWEKFGWERYAEVDSEVIFAAIADSGLDGNEALGLIRGDAAVAWIELDRPHTLRLGRLDGRPLVIAHTPNGSLIYASTKGAIAEAWDAIEGKGDLDFWEAPIFSTMTVRNGVVTDVADVPKPKVKAIKVKAIKPKVKVSVIRRGETIPDDWNPDVFDREWGAGLTDDELDEMVRGGSMWDRRDR